MSRGRAKTRAWIASLTMLPGLLVGGCGSESSEVLPRTLQRVEFAAPEVIASLDGWGERPARIVFIVADTLRRDALSVYGGDAVTPSLDALAGRSQVFRNASSSYYQTSMSMGSLLTGLTPSIESSDPDRPVIPFGGWTWCGLARFAGPDESTCIPEQAVTLAEAIRDGGYWTIGVTSNGFLFEPFGAERGFDDWNEVGERMLLGARQKPGLWKKISRSRSGTMVNRRVRRALWRRESDNFFLYVHYMDVHDYSDFELPSDDPAEAAAGQGSEAPEYRAAVERLDEVVGELVAELESLDLLEGTAIVFTSDHGERLFESHFTTGLAWHAGNPAFEELLSVPLFVTPPTSYDDSQLMRGEDVYRLITRMAGSDPGGEESLARDELFVGEPEYQTYRQGRWKSYVRREDGAHFLVDLSSDPGEAEDVAAQHPEIVRAHAARLAELTRKLAAHGNEPAELSEEDIRRLRELGYME